jgi:hypothetical protein
MLPPGLRIPKAASTMMWMKNPFGLMERCAKRFGEPYAMGLEAHLLGHVGPVGGRWAARDEELA